MRKAAQRKVQPGAATAQAAFLPPAIGGLNTRDPRSSVPPSDALLLVDYFPGISGMQKRLGTLSHITLVVQACESLMPYVANSGTQALFAAVYKAFYNVTAAGALGAAVVSGLSNAKWQYTNFTNSGGTAYLCCFNGVDSPQYWDGATWTAITGASTPSITGLTTTTIVAATVHQRRMWLVQTSSLKLWYLPIDSVGGAAQAIDLGGVANLGGYVMAINTMTVDGGAGLDDYLVAITSAGQLVAYRGTDPTSASTWELVGVWNIAKPLGRRSLYQFRGDALVITVGGVASVKSIMAGNVGSSIMITDKIAPTYINTVGSGSSEPDMWQLLYYPKADMLILSCPADICLAMNTVTGAWAKWSFVSRCWALLNDEPYFARYNNGNEIVRFWVGYQDNINGVTQGIAGQIVQGFSDFGAPLVVKKAAQIRFLFNGSATTTIDFGFQPDYRTAVQSQGQISISATDGMTARYPCTANGSALALYFYSSSSGVDTYDGAYVTYQTGSLIGATATT